MGLAVACLAFGLGVSGQVILDDQLLVGLAEVARGGWGEAAAFAGGLGSRQVSMASFALQAKLLGADPAISRLVNLGIHAGNVLLVRHVVLLAAHRSGYATQAPALAALVALAWAVLPVHATAVLYPIQRMTLLGASGSLLVFALVLGKFSGARLLLATVAWALAIFAKENAVLAMPAALVFRGLLATAPRQRRIGYWLLAALSAAYIALVIWFEVALESVLRYSAWDFGLIERMLLAPAILGEYAAAVLLPLPQAFSFYHDDYLAGVSRPLSAIHWLALIGAPLCFLVLARLADKIPLAAAGLALFVALHTVESTAIAIDLFFEHRNYLPSVGLVLALFALCAQPRLQRYKATIPVMYLYLLYLLGVLGYRSHIIAGEEALARHHLARHPTSFRAIDDALRFNVPVAPAILRRYPYPIELQALALRAACNGEESLLAPGALDSTTVVPKRSLRMHADLLRSCRNPCVIPSRYVHLVSNAYLMQGRIDSYYRSFEQQLDLFLHRRDLADCRASSGQALPDPG